MCATLMASFLFAQTVSTFENLTLAADTFWDGSDLTGGFSSGNAGFPNDYNPSWFSWSGFTYSNIQDSVTAGYGNQYAAAPSAGYNGSSNYAIANEYGNAKVRLTGNAAGKLVHGCYITNTTYAYLSMRDGDMFAKRFGGVSGYDHDWFKLIVKGYLNGVEKTELVEFYLADYRDNNNANDYIVHDWRWLNLQPLGNVDSIQFFLSSSDAGQFGMNTPAYFAIDNFTTADELYAVPVAADDAVSTNYLNDTLIDVLSNDASLVADPITLDLISGPQITGAVAAVVNNQIQYTPLVGIVATDSLWYKVTDNAGASDTALLVINVLSLNGVNDVTDANISLLPNPFSEGLEFTVSGLQPNTNNILQVFDEDGRMVVNEQLQTGYRKLETGNWSSGVYFVKVCSGKGSLVKKIVKQ